MRPVMQPGGRSDGRSADGAQPADEVPVRTKRWLAAVMIPVAAFFCLAQASFMGGPSFDAMSGGMKAWTSVSVLFALALPFALLWRDARPEPVFWCCAAAVAVFPYAPMPMLMALTGVLARRSDPRCTVRVSLAGLAASLYAELRDAVRPTGFSFWHQLFAEPGTGSNGVPAVVNASNATVIATAAVVALIETAAAVLLGLHIRSRARLHEADARAQAAQHHAENLQSDLTSQQLADAIAAEAHDTLAHSLSLIALNASALRTEASRLEDSPETRELAHKAEDIRRQAAGALDEAHSIINMLRDPAQAWEQLAPSADTSLTRESLDGLIADARNGGMRLNTWIDVRQLSDLDDGVAKIAYRAVQEGLTNARRHAPGQPVSLEVGVGPDQGVHLHISNPVEASDAGSSEDSATAEARNGAGLPGLAARVKSAGGACRFGEDDRHVFHLDVTLPWRG
ncbi:histidine kinase [Bifidobacterium avesanii]|nr:histidine kinase [Bifidobacterium avesanii]